MLGRTDARDIARTMPGEAETSRVPTSQRVSEAIPALVSWLTVLAPVWLSLIHPNLGLAFVGLFIVYFVVRGMLYGARGIIHRRRIVAAVETDWLARLENGDFPLDWRECYITLLIRAFRESNLAMLRNTLAAIYTSNWPKTNGILDRVEVVFATEEHDEITPPLVDLLASDFAGQIAVRQIKHPAEPNTLPGPSTAMHYVGRVLYQEVIDSGASPHKWIVADLDADTLLHTQYLPCLVHQFVADAHRQLRVFQPVVAFTIDYWRAPLHSRLSALGTTSLTVSWHGRPEIAFTGAAASLALLRSVDFWPTNSHSQDSGIDLRFRLRYGRRFRVVGLPLPLRVYPVMPVGADKSRWSKIEAYLRSYASLFRQSARWREGPLDEFVEAVRQRHFLLMLHRLWNGIERDTVAILPGYGLLGARLAVAIQHPGSALRFPDAGNGMISIVATLILSLVSLLGLILFWQLLGQDGYFVTFKPWHRRVFELLSFWIVFGFYIPIITGLAGLKTATLYLLGHRPRGHFTPTPK